MFVQAAHNRRHFARNTAGYNHQIGLARRGAIQLHAKTGHIIMRGLHAHHFDGAAGEAKEDWPHGAAAAPIDDVLKAISDYPQIAEFLFYSHSRTPFFQTQTSPRINKNMKMSITTKPK